MSKMVDTLDVQVPYVAVSREPDLWCTYAAVRTLRWLGRANPVGGPLFDVDGTANYLAGRRNTDGGYAWSRGMPSDAWATFYSVQALRDLRQPVAAIDKTAAWLVDTWSGDAYAMTPGQQPDAWATHFSARTTVEACGTDVPDRTRLLTWLAALQTSSGGLTWSPDHEEPDVRACYYGVAAWRALSSLEDVRPPWDVSRLVAWLRARQDGEGGFRFTGDADLPCLWATYRASSALDILGERPLADAAAFVRSMRGKRGSFVRWPGYAIEDVWAAFSAVGTLVAVGDSHSDITDAVANRLSEFACTGGGFTYREPITAADALTASAAVLSGRAAAADVVPWLESCQLPNEGGVMYMPGRGSEVRCTAWAMAAGAFSDNSAGRERIALWLPAIQNPDGGFGYWEGRGSDLVSTASAVAVADQLGAQISSLVDTERMAAFVRSCATDDGHSNVPGMRATLRASTQALRIRGALGDADRPATAALLENHRVSGGGFANEGNRIPDLLSTYEAVLAADVQGVPLDTSHVRRFVTRVSTPAGTAWTPLGPPTGGALADGLAALLRARLDDSTHTLPPITLS